MFARAFGAALLLTALAITLTCGRGSSQIPSALSSALGSRALAVGTPPGRAGAATLGLAEHGGRFVFGGPVAAPSGASGGGSSRYQAELDSKTAVFSVRRHDSKSSLTVRPKTSPIGSGPGVVREGSVVFAAEHGDAAIVLTPGTQGIKEDIVLTRALGDALTFEWELTLGDGLEARLDADGDVNVYGPSKYLSGQIHIGDDKSGKLLEEARANAARGGLLYRIPAPVVRQASGEIARAVARYELSGAMLRLVATGLDSLEYPINIDPTILITTTQDFELGGNNEGGVEIGNSQVTRSRPLAGLGSWTAISNMPAWRRYHATVAYSGYLFLLGGLDANGSATSEVWSAPINSNGAIGSWTQLKSLPAPRWAHSSVAYNGFLYAIGGHNNVTEVYVARVNADGTLSTWQATTSLPSAQNAQSSVAHNGFLYVLGGSYTDKVLMAPISGGGTLGAWTPTSSFSGPRAYHASVAYNDALYVIGGYSSSGAYLSDVQVARVKSDGSLGPWKSTTTFTTARSNLVSLVDHGYLYVIGGCVSGTSCQSMTADVQMAPVLSDGSLGAFVSTTALPAGRSSHSGAVHDRRFYVLGGFDNGGSPVAVLMAPIGGNGRVTGWTAGTSFSGGRSGHVTVAHNGYLYVVGGSSGGGLKADVQFARLYGDGGMGPWTATQALPSARNAFAAVAHDSMLYVIGGCTASDATCNTSTAEVLSAPIRADGSIGSWTPSTPLPSARGHHAAVVLGGYLYALGGFVRGGGVFSDVLYTPIGPSGSLGAIWTAGAPLSPGRAMHGAAAHNGRIYVVGGTTSESNWSGGLISRVDYSVVGPSGAPGAWTAGAVPTVPRALLVALVAQGNLISLGGWDGSIRSEAGMARIRGDGSLEAWQASTPMTVGRMNPGAAEYNGFLYVTGGETSSGFAATTEVGQLEGNVSPAANALDNWTTTTPFNGVRLGHTTVAQSGHLLVLGGWAGGGYYDDVQSAPINVDGTVGTWKTTAPFPVGRAHHCSVAVNGFVYVIGGVNDNSGGAVDDVRYAPVTTAGSVGPWATTTKLPTPLGTQGGCTIDGGRIYVAGGSAGSRKVLWALIQSNGSLGSWTETASLNGPHYVGGTVASNGYLYVVGGSGTAAAEFAAIEPSGGVGPWAMTTSLPSVRYGFGIGAANGFLYVVSGGTPSGNSDQVLIAPINPDGRVGSWSLGPSINLGREYASSAIANGTLYVAGGRGYYNDVQFAQFLTPPARGLYSRLLDLGGTASTVNSITVNGSPASRGVVQLDYRVAPASGVFGATVSKGVVSLGSPVSVGETNARYLWLRLLLDDSGAVSGGGSARDVTDISLDFATGKPPGATCGGGSDCLSGFCVDGVCCDSACTGRCQACNLPGSVGTCKAMTGSPVSPRPSCATDGTVCGGRCDGTVTAVCAYPGSSTNCRAASCTAGIGTAAASCDGAGACPAAVTTACTPYVCGPNACLTNCTSDANCISTHFCFSGVCVPKKPSGQGCGAAGNCSSGFCANGACCDSACTGQCQACNLPGSIGTCMAVTGSPVGPRPACATDGTVCGGRCDGTVTTTCAYAGSSNNCRAGTCQ